MIRVIDIVLYLREKGMSADYHGKENLQIDGYSGISDLEENTVTWLRKYNESYVDELQEYSNILVVTTQEVYRRMENMNVLVVEKPKMCFFEIVKRFFIKERAAGISQSAIVKNAKIGKNVSIGDNCIIGEDVVIGDNVIIKNNVVIECPTVIGENCTIASGVIIGSDGFGYYYDVNGNNTVVPHVGGVQIGSHVDIGANTCIDRGTINDTVIGSYTKIDNLCHIAHNVKIGENVFVIALSMIGGSAVLDDGVYVAPGAKVMNQLRIGRNAFIGMGAVVTGDVDENDVVAGVPAKVIRKRRDTDRE